MRYLRMGLIVAAACMAFASTAGAVVVKLSNGHRVSLMLRRGAKHASIGASTAARDAPT